MIIIIINDVAVLQEFHVNLNKGYIFYDKVVEFMSGLCT